MGLKKYFSKFLTKKRKQKLSKKDNQLRIEIAEIINCEIQNIVYYQEAFSLKKTIKKNKKSYERLEFLGDAVLGSIVSGCLFHFYPDANEGFLTQMKSKIVNRKNLNSIGDHFNITSLIVSENGVLSENISGNLLESLIGAIYLDLGYDRCQQIVLDRFLTSKHINKLEDKIVSYKSLLLEWSQKTKQRIRYQTLEENQPNNGIVFRAYVWLNNEKITHATESSKKKAEEKAAQRAFYCLNKKEDILGHSKNNS